MELVIHDLDQQEWDRIKDGFKDPYVISDNRTIHPCSGCFGCWNKEPGVCVIKDGYEDMGKLIHLSDEVFVISRYTYGGFSSFVKNVFDRCLAYVLPHFEIVEGESHHMKRYDEDKAFSFTFYGPKLTNEEQESAKRYVHAVCTNIRGYVKNITFQETEERPITKKREEEDPDGETIFLNASLRYVKGNTARLAKKTSSCMFRQNRIVDLMRYAKDLSKLVEELHDVPTLVLCQPLYVDGLPSQLIRFLETFEKTYDGKQKKIYVLANMGLYESRQLVNMFETVKQWCKAMDFRYCGALGVSAGELVGVLLDYGFFGKWPLQTINNALIALAKAIDRNETIEDTYTEPLHFPRSLYIAIANSGWKKAAKRNGIDPGLLFRSME